MKRIVLCVFALALMFVMSVPLASATVVDWVSLGFNAALFTPNGGSQTFTDFLGMALT